MLAKQLLEVELGKVLNALNLPWPKKMVVSEPKNPLHGDLSTNAALLLAREAQKPPLAIANEIAEKLAANRGLFEKVEVAGPGFCNVFFQKDVWRNVIGDIEKARNAYGNSTVGQGKRALVEYVSANPTGPLHVGHGRGAALGDSVARLLRAAGFATDTEYYLNDAGRQMRTLGRSIWLRVLEASGKNPEFPEDYYRGAYIGDLAKDLLELYPDLAERDEEEAIQICQKYGMDKILAGIRDDLGSFDCEHQNYFSEQSLVDSGAVRETFAQLENSGQAFEADGALWFRSSAKGDDRDRVLRKSDGSLTYFASDIAYHKNKFNRGYDWLIDVWGADHHGYIQRMRGAIEATGEDPEKFSVLLVQLVGLTANGVEVPMSTRAGQFETLADVIREVGKDAARFMFLSRSSDSPLEFDLELAKKRSMENPVYYVQYAHARIQALLRRAADRGIELPDMTPRDVLEQLDNDEDLAMLRKLASFEDVVAAAALNLAPQFISVYLMELAGRVHSYYAKFPVLGEEESLTRARLALLRAAGQVLKNGLFLLGVDSPEAM